MNNPTALTLDNRYIVAFNGVILYRTAESTRDYHGNLSLQASVNAGGLASANTNVATDLMNADRSASTNYSTAFLVTSDPKPNPQIMQFPSLASAIDAFSAARATQVGTYDQMLKSDLANEVTYALAGVPVALCKGKDAWQAEAPADAKFTATLNAVNVDGPAPQNGKVTCLFRVGFRPTQPLIDPAAEPVRLSYKLVTAEAAPGDKHVVIAAEPVQFTATRAPYLSKKGFADTFTATRWLQGNDSGNDLQWHVPIGIDATDDAIEWNATITAANPPNHPQLTCTGRFEAIDLDLQAATPIKDAGSDTGVVNLVFSRRTYARENLDDSATEVCTLRGGILMPMHGSKGRKVTRLLPSDIQLRYPRQKQTPPPTQPTIPPPASGAGITAQPNQSGAATSTPNTPGAAQAPASQQVLPPTPDPQRPLGNE